MPSVEPPLVRNNVASTRNNEQKNESEILQKSIIINEDTDKVTLNENIISERDKLIRYIK